MNDQTHAGDLDSPSRRRFLSTAAAAGAVLALDSQSILSGQTLEKSPARSTSKLHVRPRYHRWHVDPGVEWIETNTKHASLDWTIPLNQVALVLVDVWDRHYLKDTAARAEAVIDEKLVPFLSTCRDSGMTIVHAPSPPQATPHPNWVNAGKSLPAAAQPDVWPPSAFRSKSGQFQAYSRPSEPRAAELAQLRADLKIHPRIRPVGNEPVVATGEELHQLCQRSGVLFLLFAGFNTNARILARDYGTLEMSRRGYEVILVRDCTTGMESRETQPTLSQTNGAILLLEMFGQYTVTSDEVRAGLREV
ncbi:MAG: nicotinamidase-like amidase [Planctomycetaceae bacterium]|nr:nicotinamidase-like amidase [Planctomycetaceae bacterium]